MDLAVQLSIISHLVLQRSLIEPFR